MSGSWFNRVRAPHRDVGGAAHTRAAFSAPRRLRDAVLGGSAADTERRAFGARASPGIKKPPTYPVWEDGRLDASKTSYKELDNSGYIEGLTLFGVEELVDVREHGHG